MKKGRKSAKMKIENTRLTYSNLKTFYTDEKQLSKPRPSFFGQNKQTEAKKLLGKTI